MTWQLLLLSAVFMVAHSTETDGVYKLRGSVEVSPDGTRTRNGFGSHHRSMAAVPKCALFISNDGPATCTGITSLVVRGGGRVYQIRKGPLTSNLNIGLHPMWSWTVKDCEGVDMPRKQHEDSAQHANNNGKIQTKPIVSRKETSNEPIIAVCGGTTSKGEHGSFHSLSLFRVLLPSLASHLEKGYKYWVYFAYDNGDSFFDNSKNRERIKTWFKENVEDKNQGIQVKLKLIVNNNEHKPGPAFNVAIKAAYDDGADYFFRVNDDSQIQTEFASRPIAVLKSLCPPNIGVVGPKCDEGNTNILTHDFTHRTHMKIFNGIYYPVELTDWWMDDWITHVYGDRHTFRLPDVIVKHMVGKKHYDVDFRHKKALPGLEMQGHAAIEAYVGTMGVTNCVPKFGLVTSNLRTYSQALIDKLSLQAQCSPRLQFLSGLVLSGTPKAPHYNQFWAKSGPACCQKCSIESNRCHAFSFSGSTCYLFDERFINAVDSANISVEPSAIIGIDLEYGIRENPVIASIFQMPTRTSHKEENKIIKVNFGMKSLGFPHKAPTGYMQDFGTRYEGGKGTTNLKFGWSCAIVDSVRRREKKPVVLGTMILLDRHDKCHGAKWQIELEKGVYAVVVGYSDPLETPQTSGCELAEGTPVENTEVERHFNNQEFRGFVRVKEDKRLTFTGRYAASEMPCRSISYMLIKAIDENLLR